MLLFNDYSFLDHIYVPIYKTNVILKRILFKVVLQKAAIYGLWYIYWENYLAIPKTFYCEPSALL